MHKKSVKIRTSNGAYLRYLQIPLTFLLLFFGYGLEVVSQPITVTGCYRFQIWEGKALRWGGGKEITFQFDRSIPSEWHDPIRRAAAAWNLALRQVGIQDVKFALIPDPQSANIIRAERLGGQYADRTFAYAPVESSISEGRFNDIVKAELIFNIGQEFTTSDESGKFDVQGIATHELGHWLGFADFTPDDSEWSRCKNETVMDHPSLWRGTLIDIGVRNSWSRSLRDVKNGDLEGLWYLYRSVPSSPEPSGLQPPMKAPWEGIYRISQGNNASYSHNKCGKRKLYPNDCAWENTYAIDVALPYGTPVLAPADGVISFIKNDTSGPGGRELALKVKGPTGAELEMVFLHLSRITVFSGTVCQGQVIAYSGASSGGSETGVSAHLHFHIWSGIGSRDSHTRPIERLVLRRADEINFREYDARQGDLDDMRVANWEFESDNHATNVCGPQPPLSKEKTATVLVIDVSGSMGQSWKGGIKLESAKNAAQRTIDLIEQEIQTSGAEHRISVVTFSSDAQLPLPLTSDYQQARNTIISLGSRTSTNLGAGLQVALTELAKSYDKGQRFIILLSDGMTNTGMSRSQILSGPVAEARRKSICIHTVGFGDPGDIDEDFLRQIASGSGCGVYSYAGSGFELMNVYIKLRHISLGQPAGEFSSLSPQSTRVNLLTGMTATLGTVYIPERQQALYFTLTWSEDGRLQARLIDPSGREVTASYPGAQMRYFDQMVNIILSQPRPGWWTVAAYGERVPLRGTEYYAIVSTRPGGLAIPIALPKVCLELKGQGINETICPPAPGILPPWLVITISVIVLLVAFYLRLTRGGL